MDDDLDDLLNEVESKYCVSKQGGEAPKQSKWKEELNQVNVVNTTSTVNRSRFESGQAG